MYRFSIISQVIEKSSKFVTFLRFFSGHPTASFFQVREKSSSCLRFFILIALPLRVDYVRAYGVFNVHFLYTLILFFVTLHRPNFIILRTLEQIFRTYSANLATKPLLKSRDLSKVSYFFVIIYLVVKPKMLLFDFFSFFDTK